MQPVMGDTQVMQGAGQAQEMEPGQDKLEAILAKHAGEKGSLIAILQETQEQYGFLSRDNMTRVAQSLKVPLSRVFGIVTFYAQFHLNPRGRHIIRVCLGTACHVRGGEQALEDVSNALGIAPGQTSPDLQFTLEKVACLGACGLSPTMMVNDRTYGRLTKKKIGDVLKQYR